MAMDFMFNKGLHMSGTIFTLKRQLLSTSYSVTQCNISDIILSLYTLSPLLCTIKY